ncbi:MAG: PilZ domain-containing protein [candidate division NC10 bacterium]|nr:PilZ domain-containing protein [candidate division NC10 bacterium]
MAKRKRRFKGWFRRESALEEVQPPASAETLPGVEAESAQPVPDGVGMEPPTEAPEAGVEVLVAVASDGGEPQSAVLEADEVQAEPHTEAPEARVEVPLVAEAPEGVEVQISAGAAEAVEVQLPPESAEEVPPQPSSEAPEEVVAQFVVQAPPETKVQEAAEAPPEVETLLTPEEEAALRDQQAATRRQYARFRVGGKAKGRVTAIYDAVVVNISIGGSLIEHAHVVRPGTLSSLDLDVLGKRLRLKCRVARSVVHGSQVLPTGERELIYRTGLEFLDMSDAMRQMIGRYIQSMMNEEPH